MFDENTITNEIIFQTCAVPSDLKLLNFSLMKRVYWTFVSGLLLTALLLNGCRPKSAQETASLGTDTSSLSTADLTEYKKVCDSIITQLGKLPSLSSVCEMAGQVIRFKDSLEWLRNTPGTLSKEDSLLTAPLDKKGYETLLAYQRLVSFGLPVAADIPEVIRNESISDDLSLKLLPSSVSSSFFTGKKFFFLGGGPFLNRVEDEQGKSIFKDPQGKPEIRFSCSVNENSVLLLDAVSHIKNIHTGVTFGPPLSSYESGLQEVNGIGSLAHEFAGGIPVMFITTNGIIPARLISVTHKLVPEQLGCVSDNPRAVFACAEIPGKEILAVYIPLDDQKIITCTVKRKGKLWTADLNSDGVPEIACVSDTFEGISSDTMARIIWYVNMEGTWKIVDRAEELDCT